MGIRASTHRKHDHHAGPTMSPREMGSPEVACGRLDSGSRGRAEHDAPAVQSSCRSSFAPASADGPGRLAGPSRDCVDVVPATLGNSTASLGRTSRTTLVLPHERRCGRGLTGQHAVKQVRGPFLELPPHPGHTTSERELAALCTTLRGEDIPLAADLFSGAGGMSTGLEAGFRVVRRVDHYTPAVETHCHRLLVCPWMRTLADRRQSNGSRRF